MSPKGKISDLFFSFQGEGLYLGEPQIFVRLARCNISPRCSYCDTLAEVREELWPEEILSRIERKKWPTKFISLTGGEPLLQTEFLDKLLTSLKKRKFKTYLETNGTLPEALASVIDGVDIIAMDIKLPSSGQTGPFWHRHGEFLRLAKKKEIMIKVVLTQDTEKKDLARAIRLVKDQAPAIPFILQPVTPGGREQAIGDKKLYGFFLLCRQHLKKVLVIPQLHAILGIK